MKQQWASQRFTDSTTTITTPLLKIQISYEWKLARKQKHCWELQTGQVWYLAKSKERVTDNQNLIVTLLIMSQHGHDKINTHNLISTPLFTSKSLLILNILSVYFNQGSSRPAIDLPKVYPIQTNSGIKNDSTPKFLKMSIFHR